MEKKLWLFAFLKFYISQSFQWEVSRHIWLLNFCPLDSPSYSKTVSLARFPGNREPEMGILGQMIFLTEKSVRKWGMQEKGQNKEVVSASAQPQPDPTGSSRVGIASERCLPLRQEDKAFISYRWLWDHNLPSICHWSSSRGPREIL